MRLVADYTLGLLVVLGQLISIALRSRREVEATGDALLPLRPSPR